MLLKVPGGYLLPRRLYVGGPDTVSAGPVATEEATDEAGIAAGETADELDLEGADAAVAAGDVGEGAGVLVDQILALGADLVCRQRAALVDDSGRLRDAVDDVLAP